MPECVGVCCGPNEEMGFVILEVGQGKFLKWYMDWSFERIDLWRQG
jgi:hypothetical protein